jgi:hypothetical protein
VPDHAGDLDARVGRAPGPVVRAIAFQATPCVPRCAVLAIGTIARTAPGYATAHSRACIPPSDPPLTASTDSIPSARRNARCARTMSPTVTTGKVAPYGLPLAGSMDVGPVEPRHEPMRFVHTTK